MKNSLSNLISDEVISLIYPCGSQNSAARFVLTESLLKSINNYIVFKNNNPEIKDVIFSYKDMKVQAINMDKSKPTPEYRELLDKMYMVDEDGILLYRDRLIEDRFETLEYDSFLQDPNATIKMSFREHSGKRWIVFSVVFDPKNSYLNMELIVYDSQGKKDNLTYILRNSKFKVESWV